MVKKLFFIVSVLFMMKAYADDSSTENYSSYLQTSTINTTTLKFIDAVASSDGLTITMNFTNNVFGSNTGFRIFNTTDRNFSNITGWGSSTLIGTLNTPIVYGEPVNISYKDLYTEGLISGDLEDESGTKMEFFLKELVDVSAILFEGTEKYVSATAPSGGDGSSSNPYSISDMVSNVRSDYASAAAKGLRYNLQAGNYGANVFQLDNVDGAFGKPIIIEGYQNTIGDNPDLNWSVGVPLDPTVMPYFEGTITTQNGILVFNGSSHIKIKNIQVKSFKNPVYFNNVNYAWLDNIIVEKGYKKNIQLVGSSIEGVITNCVGWNGNTMNISINGDNHLVKDNLSYCNSTSYVTDYYFSIKGKHHVLRNNLAHRIGDLSHNGHAMSIQTDAPNNNTIDLSETYYNYVDSLESINIVKAIEFRHGGTRHNVARGINSHAVFDGGQNQTGGVMFRDNASFNVFENSIVDTNKGSDGFAMAFVESVEIGVGLGHDNIVRNNIFKNIQFTIVVRNYNSSRTPLMYNNKIYNNTFYNSDYLFKIPNESKGVSMPLDVNGNEFKNNIFNEIPSLNIVGSRYYNVTDFTAPLDWNTNNFSGNTIWGTEGTNANTANPEFVDAVNGDFQLKATSQLIDAGTNLSSVNSDFGGDKRPQGASHDIGAFEFLNSFNGTAGDDVSICEGDTIMLTASGGTSYLWSSGETTPSISVSPTTTTTYSVTISDADYSNTDEVIVTVDQAPSVSLGEDVLICYDESVVLTAEGTGDFLWSTGETTPSIVVSPTATTTYSVTASTSCSSVATDEIVVTVTEQINLDAGNDVTICSGENITLTAASNGNLLWSTGETTASITVSPNTTTTYSVTASLGSCSFTDEVTVTVEEAPSVSLGDDVLICYGESVVLTAQGNGNFLWSTGETTPSIVVNPSTTTTYSVTASTSVCSSAVTDEIIVNVTEQFNIDAGSDVTICTGESVTLSATSSTGNFLWNTGETTSSITISPSETTTYSVTTSLGNCSLTDEVTVTVGALPSVNIAVDEIKLCLGESAEIIATGTGDFLWSTAETSPSITINPTAVGTYTYTVTASSSCGAQSVSDEVLVTVYDAVVANAGEDVTITVGDEITLTASGGSQYLWSTGETTESITVRPIEDTTYSVEVSNENCSDTDAVFVRVVEGEVIINDGQDITICKGEEVTLEVYGGINYLWGSGETSKTIIVKPDQTTTYYVSAVRNNANEAAQITVIVNDCSDNNNNRRGNLEVYPNPTEGLINIFLPELRTKLKISLVSLNGSLMYNREIKADNNGVFTQIDLSRMAKGIYFLRMFNENFSATKKILVI